MKSNKRDKKLYKEEYVNIGGIEQYFLHYQTSPENPVFLFIHGGPGQSETMFAYVIEEYSKRNYNIVYYDQRGAGKTFMKNRSCTADFNSLKQDLSEAVLYIKKKYKKDKIGIIGHSWGSVLGSMFAMEHPEHLSCYIGCGQVIDIFENERVGLKILKNEIANSQNSRDLKAIKNLGEYPVKYFNMDVYRKMGIVRKLQGKYKLAVAIDKKLLRLVLKSPIITIKDFIAFLICFKANFKVLDELMRFNLFDYGTEYKIPVYYVLGERDQQTPIEISKGYFEQISAPDKKLYLIPDAGHAAMLDNTREYRAAICEIAAMNC